jgi:urease accessory protein
MLEVHALATHGVADGILELPFEQRQRSRLKATLQDGEEIAVFLPRGTILRDGTLLRGSGGRVVMVCAAGEDVSTVRSSDAPMLARIAYHLGNRHVHLEVGDGFVRYQHDRVLDDMVRKLGGTVEVETAPFEPEGGAYEPLHATPPMSDPPDHA